MDVLPDRLALLDSSLRSREPPRSLVRIDSRSVDGRNLKESEVDALIESHLDILADALRAAEIIELDSTLRCVGRQVDSVDLLLAEVQGDDRPCDQDDDPNTWGELRRLVLVEDKLVRNPEAKREVLAQIVDYAHRAQEKWSSDLLAGWVGSGPADWVLRNALLIDAQLRRGEFLLLVTGDRIDHGLLRLARRFAGQNDPTNLAELALVTLALYAWGNDRLLVPYVVSAVQRHQREITIRVQVQDSKAEDLPVRVERLAGPPVSSRQPLPQREEVAAFLGAAKAKLDVRLTPYGYRTTAVPRKSLEYWMGDDDRGTIRLKIHFGGYSRDLWSPIAVGFYAELKDTPMRDKWYTGLMEIAARELSDQGMRVERIGLQTVWLLRDYPWKQPEDLTDLLEPVCALIMRCQEAVAPLVSQFVAAAGDARA